MGLHERANPPDARQSDTDAKDTPAAFRISFARRSSNTSLRSALISSRSRSADQAAGPRSPRPVARTRESVSAGTPRSRATLATGRPDSSTRRVPRSNNSCGYFLGRDMKETFLPRGTNPRETVSVKPSVAHTPLGAGVREIRLDRDDVMVKKGCTSRAAR